MPTPNINPAWRALLGDEFEKPYMRARSQFLNEEKQAGKRIFPRPAHFFRALDATPPEAVKVVILGQDPYHGEGQAEGLSFSVPCGVPHPPPILVNIFKELNADLNLPKPQSGHLGPWADQGVLLLNSVLSVEAHKAASHAGKGWEEFADKIIAINDQGAPKVFILWGAYAQKRLDLLTPIATKSSNLRTLRPFLRIADFLAQSPSHKPMIFWKKQAAARLTGHCNKR